MRVVLLVVLVLVGCSDRLRLGEWLENAGAHEECGNGIDDDGDTRLDEGCWCGLGELQACFTGTHANRAVGACHDGEQQCAVGELAEFGMWGACVGSDFPDVERCNQRDDDCDSAIDEGCACAEGDERACGREGTPGSSCAIGMQRCVEGEWSACLEARGPRPEICGNAIDDDCDGERDERCDCEPSPETCGNAIDDDCDGAIDEAPCREPGADAGTPVCDADDVCDDGRDDDCNGTVDDHCLAGGCGCTIGSFVALGAPFGGEAGVGGLAAVAYGGGELAMIVGVAGHFDFVRVTLDGTEQARARLDWLDPPDAFHLAAPIDLVWLGERWVLSYLPPNADGLLLQRLARDGARDGEPLALRDPFGRPAGAGSMIVHEGALVVAIGNGCPADTSCPGEQLYLARFGASLDPIDAPIALVAPEEHGAFVENLGSAVIVGVGARIGVLHRRWQNVDGIPTSTTHRLTIVEGHRIVGRSSFPHPGIGLYATAVELAYRYGRWLACFGFGTEAAECHWVDADGEESVDPFRVPFEVDLAYGDAIEVGATECGAIVAGVRPCTSEPCLPQHVTSYAIGATSGETTSGEEPDPEAIRPLRTFFVDAGDRRVLVHDAMFLDRVSPTMALVRTRVWMREIRCAVR